MHKETTINGINFNIMKWKLPMVLEKQGLVTGLLAEPMSIVMASGSGVSEDAVMGALVESILVKISDLDLRRVANDLLWGSQCKGAATTWREANIESLGEMDADISTVVMACAAVIMVNYGAVLKNDLGETLESLKAL